jgi:DNA polymerase-1
MIRNIAIDTETWLIAPGRLAPRLVCMSAFGDGDNRARLYAPDEAAAAVHEWLTDPRIRLIGHNMAFDLGVLLQHDPSLAPSIWSAYDQKRIWDTQIYEQLRKIALGWSKFNPETGRVPSYALASLVSEHLGEKVEGKSGEDAWRFRYRELDGVPFPEWPAEAREYAQLDAQYTWRVFQKQMGIGIPPDFERQVKYAWALHLMSAWGIRTDREAVERLEGDLVQAVRETVEKLTVAGVYRTNGTKDMAVVRGRVAQAYGNNPPVTDKGGISTSAAVLEASGDEVLQTLAGISGEQKLLNTYIPTLKAGVERPINPRFNVLVDSGRTSCRNPNLQNQPRRGGVRECFVPREGNVFVTADYHIAELCSLAQVLLDLYGESKMAEALQAGRELHLEMAAGIMGITYEGAVSRHKKGDKAVKAARQLAKAANFGFPGGLGAARFLEFAKASYGIQLSLEEGENLRRLWLERYPEMHQYFRDIGFRCNRGGGSFQLIQPRSGRIRGGVGFCDGCNSHFQGLTADGAKAALYRVVQECYMDSRSDLFGFRPVAFIHDEILIEGPEARAAAAAKRLEQVMVEQMEFWTPDIPVKADAAMMRKWYKGAEPVYDGDRLIPWEPEE